MVVKRQTSKRDVVNKRNETVTRFDFVLRILRDKNNDYRIGRDKEF